MEDNNIMSVDVLKLARPVGNIYKTVSILGIRSNQIGSKMRKELHEKLSEFTSHQDALEEIVENREQIEIARHYEQLPKPTMLALDEMMRGKIYHSDPLGE